MTVLLSRRTRSTIIAAGAALALIVAPLAVAPANAVSGYTGAESGSDIWVDHDLAQLEQNTSYSSTLTVPASNGPWGDLSTSGLPAGLSASLSGTTVTVSGTPTEGGAVSDFSFEIWGGDGAHSILTFSEVTITPDLPSTTTEATSPEAVPYTAMNLSATVTGASPTGTVTFSIGGTTIGTGTLTGVGVATYTGPIASTYAGSAVTVTATYSGDENNAGSSDTAGVYIFRSSSISGSVTVNGAQNSGSVDLLDSAGTVLQTISSDMGGYLFTVSGIDTQAEATATYYVRAALTGHGTVYYSTDGGVGQPNVTNFADADAVSPATWGTGFDIFYNVAPVWSDTTLHTPHQGSSYSDYVVATGTGTIQYALTAGSVPTHTFLAENTGEIYGIPIDQGTYTFTITASNDYGSVSHEFTLTPGPPGISPTWSSYTISDFVVGTAVHDTLTANGDPTITFSSSGTLPPGLSLSSSGVLSGTPTTAGGFSFTITITNEFGHLDHGFTVTVAAAPEIDLELNFAEGTTIDDANTDISAEGLKVGSEYTLYLHSTPVLLYTGTVDASGAFTHTVTIPADTPAGSHELILTGIAPDGSTLTAHAWFTLLEDGTIGAISYTGPLAFGLALSGDNPLLPLGMALALLTAGALLVGRQRAEYLAS